MELLPLVCFCLLTCSGTTFGVEDYILKDRTKENKPGAAAYPVVTLHPANEGMLLQCEVRGASPKPKLVWKDRAGNILPAEEPEVREYEGIYNIILKATVTKTDFYRCVSTQEGNQQVYTETYVPVHVTKMRVKEDEDVILPCSLDSTNIQSDTFVWKKDDQKEVFMYAGGTHYNNGRSGQDPQFKGRVFHFEDQLQSGNASIVIRNTTKTDSGRYSCIFPFPQPTTRSIIELIVDCTLKDRTKEDIPGSCPKPSVTNLHETNDQAQLECKVQGAFPKPKVQWLDSDNNTVPAEETQVPESKGKFNIILKTTVTKSDDYRCVSTQEEICHQIDRKIHVYFQGSNTGWIVGVGVGVGVLVIVIVILFGCYWKQRAKKRQYRDKREALRLEKSDKELINNEEETIVLS